MRLLPLALIGASLFMLSKAKGRGVSIPSYPDLTLANVDALSRMLVTETSFMKTPREMTGILQVAKNRADKHGVSLVEAVEPPGKPLWNGHSTYKSRYENAHTLVGADKFNEVMFFVAQFLMGLQNNEIGERVNFLHPQGMPSCAGGKACSSSSHECVDTGKFGLRCLPRWSLSTERNIKVIGDARFS